MIIAPILAAALAAQPPADLAHYAGLQPTAEWLAGTGVRFTTVGGLIGQRSPLRAAPGAEWLLRRGTPEGAFLIERQLLNGASEDRRRVRVRLERRVALIIESEAYLSRLMTYDVRCGREASMRLSAAVDYVQRDLRGKSRRVDMAPGVWGISAGTPLEGMLAEICTTG